MADVDQSTRVTIKDLPDSCGEKLELRRMVQELEAENERLKSCFSNIEPEDRIRFWQKVEANGQCWEWQASTDGRYGEFWYKGDTHKAHRISWFLAYGFRAKDQVCHHCDNPPCVRPSHLFEGTMSDNIKDAVQKGRVTPPTSRHEGREMCVRGHPLEGENVYEDSDGNRHCKKCKKLHNKARYSEEAQKKLDQLKREHQRALDSGGDQS